MLGRSLGWKDPLEEGMAFHSSILTWRNPWMEEPGRLQSIGLQRVRHNWSSLAHTHALLKSMRTREPETKSLAWYPTVTWKPRESWTLEHQSWNLSAKSGLAKYSCKELSSVQFSHSVVSDSLRPHESQHARLPCPSPTPGVHPNSCPSSL